MAAHPRPDELRQLADEALAMKLLGDYPSGIKPGSAEERLARAALARLVRDYLKGYVGELLALAIDPTTPSRFPGGRPIRRVRFETPGRRASKWVRDSVVGQFISSERYKSRTGKLDAALHAAQQEFGLGRSTVQAIWARREALREASGLPTSSKPKVRRTAARKRKQAGKSSAVSPPPLAEHSRQ